MASVKTQSHVFDIDYTMMKRLQEEIYHAVKSVETPYARKVQKFINWIKMKFSLILINYKMFTKLVCLFVLATAAFAAGLEIKVTQEGAGEVCPKGA